ncbi:MAG: flagellar basal body L-ring protein FlgH, partial [Pseudomonadota bacterium]
MSRTLLPIACRPFAKAVGFTLLLIGLSGCNIGSRIMEIGKQPALSPIQNPIEHPTYQPVRMPMPAPQVPENHANSLWQSGSRAFFRDQRANDIGDILTVSIAIDDSASINNSSSRSRSGEEDAGLPSLLGFESRLGDVLPDAVDPSSLIEFDSNSSTTGTGQITRGEEIQLRIAAIVTQILP